MKFSAALSVLALAGASIAAPQSSSHGYPTTTLAGVEVIDTQLVRDVRELVKVFNELQPYLYKHVMRTWLWGAAVMNANATIKAMVDPEVHAVGSMMHDMGWDMRPNSPYVTPDNRFEADSGRAAIEFVKAHPCSRKSWSDTRLEQMYDGIALQVEASLIRYKNFNSQFIQMSVGLEYPGPRNPAIPLEDYNNILAMFPNDYLFRGSNETFTWMAQTKPAGSYDNFIQTFGDKLVPGYNSTGHRSFDIIQGGVAMELAMYPNTTKYD